MEQLIKYRTYYDSFQYESSINENTNKKSTIIINTNDEIYQLSKNLNKYWSEFALMYEIWKRGKESVYIGFDQYDDHIDENKLLFTDGKEIYWKHHGIVSSLSTHYRCRHEKIFDDLLIKTLDEEYGANSPYSKCYKNGKIFYYGSCFIMKWEIFDEMCEFVFNILNKIDFKLNLNHEKEKYDEFFKKYPLNQKRQFGFMAERLLSIFIVTKYMDKITTKLSLNDMYYNIVNVKNETQKKESDEQIKKNTNTRTTWRILKRRY